MENTFNGGALVPAKEAARVLGMQHKTLLQLLRQGHIRGTKIAKGWFLHPAVLNEIRQRALLGIRTAVTDGNLEKCIEEEETI